MKQNHDNSTPPKSDILHRLSSIEAMLLAINTDSESDFLKLGRELQTGYSSVAALTEKTRDTAERIGGTSEGSALATIERRVNLSLEALKTSRENVVSKSTPVQRIVNYLEALNTKRSEIEVIAKYLRAVALNIFIETSRSEVSSENFSIIAQEIKDLSENIIGLAQNIREGSEASRNLFLSIYREISEGIQKMSALTGHAEHSVGEAIEKAEELVTFSLAMVEEAGTRSQAIRDQVGQIVMGVQFHDNMRQRIEHVVSGLNDVADLCRDEKTDASEEKNLGTAHAITVLQAAQIHEIVKEIDTIYRQNRDAFETIITEVSLLTRTLARLISGGETSERHGEGIEGPFTLLRSALSNFRNLEGQATALENRLVETYRQATQTASTLSSQAERVHEVSRESHIKALNAIIAARHLGNEGRTLSVLAEEMKSLSDQADAFVVSAEEIIGAIVSEISGISRDMEAGDEETTAPESETTLDDIITAISEMYDGMNRESEMLCLDADQLNAVLSGAKESLDFFPAMAKAIQHQLNRLNEIGEILAPWADETIHAHIADTYMSERYTMETERAVHKKSTASLSEKQAGEEEDLGFEDFGTSDDNVELFDDMEDAPGEEKEAEKKKDDEDLGDNIELF